MRPDVMLSILGALPLMVLFAFLLALLLLGLDVSLADTPPLETEYRQSDDPQRRTDHAA
jgi:hypothetical protein